MPTRTFWSIRETIFYKEDLAENLKKIPEEDWSSLLKEIGTYIKTIIPTINELAWLLQELPTAQWPSLIKALGSHTMATIQNDYGYYLLLQHIPEENHTYLTVKLNEQNIKVNLPPPDNNKLPENRMTG